MIQAPPSAGPGGTAFGGRRIPRPGSVLACGLAATLALFVFGRMAPLQGWDEAFYVGQMTSALSDRDLLLQNDLLPFHNSYADTFRGLTSFGPSGAVDNTFGIGPAVLHSGYAWPFLVGAKSHPERLRLVLSLGALALLTVFAIATVEILERFGFSRGVSLGATALGIFSSPLALYGTRFTLGSHLPSAACASVTLLVCLAWVDQPTPERSALLGLSAGLLVITRWQDVVLLAPLGVALLWRAPAESMIRSFLAACVGFGSVVSVQLAAWKAQFGHWLVLPQGSGYLGWTHPKLGSFLFSTYHGAVPWAPGLILGLLGLLLVLREEESRLKRGFVWGLLLSGALAIYVSALPADWWGGDSYGPRRLTSLVPASALGLAAILRRLKPLWRAPLIGALGAWTVFCASASLSGLDDLSLFLGGTGADNPRPASSYLGTAWHDSWKAAFFLKPGYALTDTPTNLDRIVGLGVVILIVFLTMGLWRWVRGSARLQRIGLGLAFSWALGWFALLASFIPAQSAANQAWVRLVCGRREALGILPSSVQGAGHLVLATYASARGDASGMRGDLAFVEVGSPGPERLLAFGQSPAGILLIKAAEERGCEASGLPFRAEDGR